LAKNIVLDSSNVADSVKLVSSILNFIGVIVLSFAAKKVLTVKFEIFSCATIFALFCKHFSTENQISHHTIKM